MLRNLRVEKYRSFDEYELRNLSRVMWRLVVETARQSSLQVFATTHSCDCIRALSSLVESRPDLAGDVSIHKIGRSIHKAVHLDAEDVRVAVEQSIEVR